MGMNGFESRHGSWWNLNSIKVISGIKNLLMTVKTFVGKTHLVPSGKEICRPYPGLAYM